MNGSNIKQVSSFLKAKSCFFTNNITSGKWGGMNLYLRKFADIALSSRSYFYCHDNQCKGM
jgi:hypothetical protein